MISNFFIVGHRGSGKSTAARLAGAQLALDVVDLDEVIEECQGASCAEIIADSEARFRRLERETLADIVDEDGEKPRIISLGAGFHPLSASQLQDGLCIWLFRDGWEEVARSGRARLRPDRDFAAELEWMIDQREPWWERAAHLRLDVPRGRGPERTARDLAIRIGWLCELEDSPLAARTWMVAADDEQLLRAVDDAELLGLAGVEVRSDLVDLRNARDISTKMLASLRNAEPDWLKALSDAAAYDVDVQFIDDILGARTLDDLSPRQLIVSSHPPQASDQSVDRLIEGAARLANAHPRWKEHIQLKWAPGVEDYRMLLDGLKMHETLCATGRPVTFLPQGDRFAWCRPPLLRQNASNYLPPGLAPHRRSHTANPIESPLDLQAWLPHLAGPPAHQFEGLLGDPVATSQGDVWHRRAARDEGRRISYLKIPFGRQGSTRALERLLDVCERFDVSGISVTSPLKQKILEADCVEPAADREMSAVNTLRRCDGHWEAIDTDEAGMVAALEEIAQRGVEPADVAIIGRGGVSPAVLRAIDCSDWNLVHHASGRRGWSDEAPDEVTLVVNAAGNSDTAYTDPPRSEVWFDLHYSGVRKPPEGAGIHINGDVFFDAQARQQRLFWHKD